MNIEFTIFSKERAGVIPFMNFTKDYNPGKLLEVYLSLCPEAGTIEGRQGGFLFSKCRAQSSSFHIHDADEKFLFQPNQKVGKDTVALMLKTLCAAVGQPPCTNHQVRVTSIKNLRRDGWDWHDIAKITGKFEKLEAFIKLTLCNLGHKNPDNLIKHYDVCMDAPAQAQFAASIAQGAGKAQGLKFDPVELETRNKESRVDYTNVHQEQADDVTKTNQDKNNELTEGEGDCSLVSEEADSEDDIPLIKLEAVRRRKRKLERRERILKEAAADDDFKENKVAPEKNSPHSVGYPGGMVQASPGMSQHVNGGLHIPMGYPQPNTIPFDFPSFQQMSAVQNPFSALSSPAFQQLAPYQTQYSDGWWSQPADGRWSQPAHGRWSQPADGRWSQPADGYNLQMAGGHNLQMAGGHNQHMAGGHNLQMTGGHNLHELGGGGLAGGPNLQVAGGPNLYMAGGPMQWPGVANQQWISGGPNPQWPMGSNQLQGVPFNPLKQQAVPLNPLIQQGALLNQQGQEVFLDPHRPHNHQGVPLRQQQSVPLNLHGVSINQQEGVPLNQQGVHLHQLGTADDEQQVATKQGWLYNEYIVESFFM